MTGLFFALLATLLVGIGARDQVLVAQLSARQGARPALLLVALASGVLAAALAAAGGAEAAAWLTGNARQVLVALALGLAGLELLFRRPLVAPAEPTHSLGAFAIVIFTAQVTDAARFVVFALAALTQAPVPVALGAAVGAAGVVGTGWAGAGAAAQSWIVPARRVLGSAVLLAALVTGLAVIRG